jgi:hypothetical protein
MTDSVGACGPEHDGLVFVERFGPCLPEVEFLPGRIVQNVFLHLFYSRALADRSLRHLRRRFPDARMVVERIPLDLSDGGDVDEYTRHVVAARHEAEAERGVARAVSARAVRAGHGGPPLR